MDATMMKEMKDTIESLGRTVEAWKGTIDDKVQSIVKGRMGEWSEKMAKIDTDLTKLEGLKAAFDRHAININKKQVFRKDREGNQIECPDDWMETKGQFGHFLKKGHQDVARNSESLERKSFEFEKKSLSVISDSDGGYTVHADFSGRMIERIWETSPVRNVANVATISTDRLFGLYDVNEVASGWVGETGARTTTATAKLGAWMIAVHEQYAEPPATQQLLDDSSMDVESWLAMKVADKFSRTENTAFISGNGVTQPRGILTYPTTGAQNVANTPVGSIEQVASGVSAGLNYTTLNTMIYRLKAQYRARAQWAFARQTIGAIRGLLDGFNRPLWEPSLQIGEPSRLLGYPIQEFDDLPALASNALAGAFADWNQFYQIVDRQGVRILRDPYTAKPYVLFYTTKRVGGDVVNFEAGKLLKCDA